MAEEEIPRRLMRFYRKSGKESSKQAEPEKRGFRESERKEQEEIAEAVYESGEISGQAEKPEKEAAEAIYRALREKGREERLKERTAELALREVRHFKSRHNRLPDEREYNELADVVYEQAKSQEEAEKPEAAEPRAKERQRRLRPSEREEKKKHEDEFAAPIPAEKKKLEVSELFGIEEGHPGSLIEQMSEEAAAEPEERKMSLEEELKKIAASAEGTTREIETAKNLCPNCSNKSSELIFCPSCNSGFCTHCAKGIKPYDDFIVYKCPKCNKEFKVQGR